MSVTIAVSDDVAQHLETLRLGDADDVDKKLVRLLEAEYRRQLARYNLTNRQFQQKYNMSFDEFEQHKVTRPRAYSWEVESDAIVWETAMDGIQTMQRKLNELLNELN
ncbi:MAG: hypothetical protein L0154_13310 [Chloroflexi bacterium]|nr:hypothetical protein [Chloroflexota bacterium]